ncbi:acetoacetyl-CoA reductase [Pseudoalteromonas sp. MMG013]|uniref:acetoacetyl-CoA reductase n=1 Tax=unclassified Pseudoalteromonas TaxID=194690 RepID=UPI001B36270E|nr:MULTISPECIES: acetoacetyl-CoA reductase [unclassified Pseudoalteromonas]MBQ4847374.1 acetoacetyl-CoA reductase [Pseudoalteromonas sp. MMG005]MBQ4851454.1 acetoacetyl-CoA reductase [Pseudoalteromonas sp. MMG012]MBQ4861623.1 acetoacetyl-CoA reductase [Pseudoalteromonas sp. MMG013]
MENQQTAIVTGAFGGIGTAIAKQLANANYFVIAVASERRSQADYDAWLNQTQINPNQVKALFLDVTNVQACETQLTEVIVERGRIDVLVNNAGITRDTSFKKMSHTQWSEVINTNLNALFNMTHPLFAHMCANKYGRIVNISSVNGQKGQFGQANYAAAKAGMIGFTKSLAYEGARAGVTVNVVAPGYTETPMVAAMRQDVLDNIKAQVPMQRLASPDEVAHAVVYLASEKAAYITGETLALNGGLYMN